MRECLYKRGIVERQQFNSKWKKHRVKVVFIDITKLLVGTLSEIKSLQNLPNQSNKKPESKGNFEKSWLVIWDLKQIPFRLKKKFLKKKHRKMVVKLSARRTWFRSNTSSALDLVRWRHVFKSEHISSSQRVQYYWTLDLSLTQNTKALYEGCVYWYY